MILGLGIALYSGWGWIAAIICETRYGHIEEAEQTSEPAAGSDAERTERR